MSQRKKRKDRQPCGRLPWKHQEMEEAVKLFHSIEQWKWVHLETRLRWVRKILCLKMPPELRDRWVDSRRRLQRAIEKNDRRRFKRKRRLADERHRKQELERMRRSNPWGYAALQGGAVYALAAHVGRLTGLMESLR